MFLTQRKVSSNYTKASFPPSNVALFYTRPSSLYFDKPPRESRTLTNFIVVYFDWAFFLGFSPFRFVREPNNYYRIYKSKIQIVVSTFLTVCFFVFSISSSRINFSIHFYKNRTPLDYFYLISFLLLFVLTILITIHIWFYKNKFINIDNFVQSDEFLLPNKKSFLQSKFFIHLICFLCLVIALYDPASKLLPTSLVSVDGTVWNLRTISLTRYTFFMINLTDTYYKVLDPEDVSTLDYFLAVIYVVGWIMRYTHLYIAYCVQKIELIFS